MAPSTRKHRTGLAVIAVACCLVLFGAYALPHVLLAIPSIAKRWDIRRLSALWFYERLEADAGKYLYLYGRKAPLDPRLVFLGIDTESYEQGDLFDDERQHPALQLMRSSLVGTAFPRAVYAEVLQRIAAAGARVVMIDVLFPTVKNGDEVLQRALDKYPRQVVIGSNLQDSDRQGEFGLTQGPASSLISAPRGTQFDPRVGFVNFRLDGDGLVRRINYRTSEVEYFGVDQGEGGGVLLSLTGQGVKQAGWEDLIPADRKAWQFRFPDQNRIPYISLKDIFVPSLWQKNFQNGDYFKDKLVFVGPVGNWSKDELPTPLGTMLGPKVHLSALNALLTGDFLRPTEPWTDIFLIFGGGAAALVVGLGVSHPLYRAGLLVALAVLFVGAAFVVFNTNGLILNLLGPTVALLSSGFNGLAWEYRKERQERARVRQTLERYVSKDVVKEVLDNPDSFLNVRGGMRKPVTILFSDVRGFTTLTESADPAQLVTQLNEYFTHMVRIVFTHHGTLDKFIGDAVMAQWGSIVTRGPEADACRAVAAALDMLKVLPKLNADWKARGFTELKIGLGVNHGDAICAHIGSEEKHEFTAIGDTVNLASRLEGATKEFHLDLLLGAQVAPLARECYHLRTVDLLQVKGKTQPVEVFTVAGVRDEKTPPPEWLTLHEEGVRAYRAARFADGEGHFTAALAELPEDWLLAEYQRRCRDYQQTPPPEGWNGVYVMTEK